MSNIHYFQRYSHRENVTTNNTLLLFSRLNHYNKTYFEDFLNAILNTQLNIGISITQQHKSSGINGIPDGFLVQSSFKIVLETKNLQGFDIAQLQRHIKSFSEESTKILMLLSQVSPNPSAQESIRSECEKILPSLKVAFVTFEQIISAFKSVLDERRDYEMLDMIEEFTNYCIETGLFPVWKYMLRIRTAAYSLNYNLKYNLYYDHISRGYSTQQYFGLYRDRSILAIGKLKHIVTAEMHGDNLENVNVEFGNKMSSEDEANLLEAIQQAPLITKDNISTDIRFFIVEKFYETGFRKTTPYGIQRSKLFDLRNVLGTQVLPENTEEIAELLKVKTWE